MKKKRDQGAKRGTMREKRTKKNIMMFVGEKGVEVRRKVKEQYLKVMAKIIPKAKIGKNMQSQRARNVSSLKASTAQTVRPESEVKAETEEREPGPGVENGTLAEVKVTQNTERKI